VSFPDRPAAVIPNIKQKDYLSHSSLHKEGEGRPDGDKSEDLPETFSKTSPGIGMVE